MGLSMSNLVLLAKKQTARGTPATPSAGANAILCRGLTPQPIKGKFVERNLIRGAKGNYGALFAGGHRVFEFEIELAGSGAAGTAPKYGPLLMGCQMSETVTPTTSVVYQPHGDDGDYMTLIANLDGVQFVMSDAKGTWSLALNAEEIPVLRFTYLGKYHPVTDEPFPPSIDFSGFQQPLTVGDDNTSVFTIAALDLVVKSFTLDYANQVIWKDLINRSGVRASDRKPTANSVFEFTKTATRNWVDNVVKGTVMPLEITHGVDAGNIVSISCPKLQFNAEPSLSEEDKTAMFSSSFAVIPNAGNDEIVLTFT